MMNIVSRFGVLVGTLCFSMLCCAAETVGAAESRPISLNEALTLFKTNNRDVRLAQRAVESAQADILSARARPNPNIGLSTLSLRPPGFRTGSSNDNSRSTDVVVQLSQLFERGGKRELRGAASEYAMQASQGDFAETVRQGTVAVAVAYYDLALAQERVRIADETVAALQRTVGAAELRLKGGDISPADLSRIRVDMLRSENDRRVAQADRERAQQSLAFLIALEAEARRVVAIDTWPTVQDSTRPADLNAVVDSRADVRASQLRVQAAEKVRDLARSLRTRDVTVAAQYERYPGQTTNNTLGFGVSVPIFINYTFEGEIRRGETNLLAAQDQLDRTRAAALTEVNRSWADLSSARERVQRYDGSLLRDAKRSADAAEFAYRNGALGVIDLLDARRVYSATRVDAAAARADLARAIVAWQMATQTYGTTR